MTAREPGQSRLDADGWGEVNLDDRAAAAADEMDALVVLHLEMAVALRRPHRAHEPEAKQQRQGPIDRTEINSDAAGTQRLVDILGAQVLPAPLEDADDRPTGGRRPEARAPQSLDYRSLRHNRANLYLQIFCN